MGSALMGAKPLQTFGTHPQPSGNPHVQTGPAAFASPMHAYGAGNTAVTHNEVRNPTNGVAHISMHP